MVLINVDDRYFLQYNRAKRYNAGTERGADRLTVTERADGVLWSVAAAALGAGERFVSTNYDGFGSGLAIEVCSSTQGGDLGVDSLTVAISFGAMTNECG